MFAHVNIIITITPGYRCYDYPHFINSEVEEWEINKLPMSHSYKVEEARVELRRWGYRDCDMSYFSRLIKQLLQQYKPKVMKTSSKQMEK